MTYYISHRKKHISLSHMFCVFPRTLCDFPTPARPPPSSDFHTHSSTSTKNRRGWREAGAESLEREKGGCYSCKLLTEQRRCMNCTEPIPFNPLPLPLNPFQPFFHIVKYGTDARTNCRCCFSSDGFCLLSALFVAGGGGGGKKWKMEGDFLLHFGVRSRTSRKKEEKVGGVIGRREKRKGKVVDGAWW